MAASTALVLKNAEQRATRKSKVLGLFQESLEVEMKSRRLMTLAEMYDFVAAKFPREVSEFGGLLEGRRTVEWKNLVDWVKAGWTKKHQTTKVGVWYVWLPACGVVSGVTLANHQDALRTVWKIAERLN